MTITYLVDGYYNPADELGVAWDDPAVDGRLGRSPSRSCPPATRRTRAAPTSTRCWQPHFALRP